MVPLVAAELSVLDVSVMAAIRSLGAPGEADVFAEIALLFLTDAQVQLSALHVAVAAGGVESVAEIAHRLRGGALETGVLRMVPVCAALEYAARAGSLEHAAAQVESLDCEFAAARAALLQVIA